MTTSALLLAAGRASRFGAPKLLARLGDGRPVAGAAAEPFLAAGLDCLAVIPADAPALREQFESRGAACAVNAHAHEGLSSSIITGIGARPRADAWLIALADMPWLRTATVLAIEQALHAGAAIAAPVYRGRRGHPVGFSAAFRDRLLALRGDCGARPLLDELAAQVLTVPVEDPGIHLDVDRPSDLRPTHPSATRARHHN